MATHRENFSSINDSQEGNEPKTSFDDQVKKDEGTLEAHNDNRNEHLLEVKGADSMTEPDEYTYTKREGFTSEIFKISVTNLPKKFGFAVNIFVNFEPCSGKRELQRELQPL